MHRLLNCLFVLLLVAPVFSAQAQQVFKTPSGQKYHLASCRMVKNVSTKLTIPEAIEAGLDACKICEPPRSSAIKPIVSPQGESLTVRCKGQTKAGTQCKHRTRIANGYCYQHQAR